MIDDIINLLNKLIDNKYKCLYVASSRMYKYRISFVDKEDKTYVLAILDDCCYFQNRCNDIKIEFTDKVKKYKIMQLAETLKNKVIGELHNTLKKLGEDDK